MSATSSFSISSNFFCCNVTFNPDRSDHDKSSNTNAMVDRQRNVYQVESFVEGVCSV